MKVISNNIIWENSCALCTVHTDHLPQGPRNQSSAAEGTEGVVCASPRNINHSPLSVGRSPEGSFLVAERGFNSGTTNLSLQRPVERSDFGSSAFW